MKLAVSFPMSLIANLITMNASQIDLECTSLRAIAQALISSTPSTEATQLHASAQLSFLKLAQLNRELLVQNKTRKQSTLDDKLGVGKDHLSLQNYNYERLHLQREIATNEQAG